MYIIVGQHVIGVIELGAFLWSWGMLIYNYYIDLVNVYFPFLQNPAILLAMIIVIVIYSSLNNNRVNYNCSHTAA